MIVSNLHGYMCTRKDMKSLMTVDYMINPYWGATKEQAESGSTSIIIRYALYSEILRELYK